jgi:hypothetical protein
MKKLNKIIVQKILYNLHEDYYTDKEKESVEEYSRNINKKRIKVNRYKVISNLLKLLNEKIK